MVLVDAADYAAVPLHLALNGTAGRAWVGIDGIHLQRNRGEDEYWPIVSDPFSSMHRAVDEIVSWLDHGSSFPAPGDDAVHTLEAIIGFHVSHGRNAAWVDLPLSGADRMLEVRSG